MALIEAQHLGRTFAHEGTETVALKRATFSVEKGEFVSIMGRSGSGKSTLLHILGLLDRPTNGSYMFNGHDTATLSEVERARVRNMEMGFVFQVFHLLPRASVLENVMLPLTYSPVPAKEHQERARVAIERVELSHRLEHLPSQLSGGEKQRVAIARALINDPPLIFADEPTGNLDSKTGERVMQVLDTLHKDGRTVLLITHETATASYANRIITLHDGEIVSDAPATKRHQHYTK